MEENKDKIQRNLLFKEFEIEKEYKDSTQKFHLKCFKILALTIFLQTSGIFFSNPLDLDIYTLYPLLIFLGSQTMNFALFMLIWKRFPRLSTYGIEMTVLFYIIGAGEFVHFIKFEVNISDWIYFVLGINIQTGSLLLLLSRIRWTHSLIIICITHVHSWVRIIDIHQHPGAQKSAIISIAVHILLAFTITYTFERADRLSYENLRIRDKQLKALEDLINQIMPISMIIIREEKVQFFNNKSQRMFSTTSPEGILQALENIKVIRKNKFAFSSFNNAYVEEDFSKNLNGSNNQFSIFDLIRDWELSCTRDGIEIGESFATIEGELYDSAKGEEGSRSFLIHLGPTIWKGKLSIVVISNEITYLRNQYKFLNDYKNQLLATVSHELRTPLNGIIGVQELLIEEIQEESIKEKLNISLRSSILLLNMINDLLDFALISKGMLRLRYEPTNITALVNETVNLLSYQAEGKGLSIKIENELKYKYLCHKVDPNRLRQVLINLIGNAIKFTKKGGILIRFREQTVESTGNTEKRIDMHTFKKRKKFFKTQFENEKDLLNKILTTKKRLLFDIEDSGIGIQPAQISTLFKHYYREKDKGAETIGVGLGLAISQDLVVMMNGFKQGAEISVSSELGKGSKFSFPIDFHEEDDESLIHLESDFTIRKFPSCLEKKDMKSLGSGTKMIFTSNIDEISLFVEKKKLNVLAVDDDQINLLVITKYLTSAEKWEFHLLTAQNGQEAIEKTNQKAGSGFYFDIFLMDCNMPVMDGFEASRNLKRMMSEKNIPSAPIIAITANVTDSDKEKCFLNGMDYFLTKPYMKQGLLDLMDEAVRKKEIN